LRNARVSPEEKFLKLGCVTLQILQLQIKALVEQGQYALLADLSRETLPKIPFIDRAKEVEDISLEIEFVAIGYKVLNALDRVINSTPFDEGATAVQVESVEGWFNKKRDGLHHDTISYRCDLEGSLLGRSRLCDGVSAKFVESITVGSKLLTDL
jgi:hypothetical protein